MFIKKKFFILVVFSFLSVSLASTRFHGTNGDLRNRRAIEIGNNQVIRGTVVAYPGESIQIGKPNGQHDAYEHQNINNQHEYQHQQQNQQYAGIKHKQSSSYGGNNGVAPTGITIGNNNVVRGGINQELEPTAQFPSSHRHNSQSNYRPANSQPHSQGNYRPVQPHYQDSYRPVQPNSHQGSTNTQPHNIYANVKTVRAGVPNSNNRVIINGVDVVAGGQISGNVCIGEGNYINGRLIPSNCPHKNVAGTVHNTPSNIYEHVNHQNQGHQRHQNQGQQYDDSQAQHNGGRHRGTDGIVIGNSNTIKGNVHSSLYK